MEETENMKILQLLIFWLATCMVYSNLYSQENSNILTDTLPEININAYDLNKKMVDIAAAINHIDERTLKQFSTGSIVQALNTMPGARMEERSPGSYRMNIRGSSLRSPFGVRNVKVYYNDLPITNPGGLTYLNQLGFNNFKSIEIIKGPGSSLYGAGTGGVMLIESLGNGEKLGGKFSYSTGSFGLQHAYGNIIAGKEKAYNSISFEHLANAGYRKHSAMQRSVFSWDGKYQIGENDLLKTTFLYGDLFYETPGALTKAEFDINPRMARPGNAFFPGAEQANTSISQKTFLGGLSYSHRLSTKWKSLGSAYGMFTRLQNPNIQNFDHSLEPHFGGRFSFQYSHPINKGNFYTNFGFEMQKGFPEVKVFKNVNGNADSLRTSDELDIGQSILFAQAVLDIKSWTITTGGSFNFLKIRFERFAPASLGKRQKKFDNQFAPRISVMKKFTGFNLYAGISRGFSPPTTSELFPTGGAVNIQLQAESGTNFDIGLKATIKKKLFLDVNVFSFSMVNNIVQRRTAGGGDFYINAGKTRQYGVETYLVYHVVRPIGFLESTNCWFSHTWHNFHYKNFTQGSIDYSGKQMPTVPPHSLSTGFNMKGKQGWTGNVSYSFVDKIPLNDANTAYSDAYHLVAIKTGYQIKAGKQVIITASIGVDNLLNQKYSLGNDANGFGGRYYNAAAGRNYFVILSFEWKKKMTVN